MKVKRSKMKQNIRRAVILFLMLGLVAVLYIYRKINADTEVIRSEEFGVHASIPSLPTDTDKSTAVDRLVEGGYGWNRFEFYYEPTINFTNYDTSLRLLSQRGVKTLGLLSFPGKERSHEEWKSFVSQVVSHYSNQVAAWEIMNEIDNYLTPEEYVAYLKEAQTIIKASNPGAKVVLSGITSRPESIKFWDGVAAADGWNYFDVIGLHHYHRQNPEKVNFGGGDLIAELSRPLSSINKYGDKKIWITEFGYIDNVGRENQANWLARSLIMARSIPEIEKIFIYRLSNKQTDFPFGLTDDNFTPFPVFYSVQKVIKQLSGRTGGVRVQAADRLEVESFQNLNGWSIADKKNGEATLKLGGGPDGTAMQIDYSFTNNPAYVLAAKTIPLGRPQAIAAWFYGDDANNVWKFRFVDAKGETFQADLGTIHSGWSYKQFVLDYDSAVVSWNGDTVIDYPITFQSVVVDRQNGKASGSAIVDEITSVNNNAELYAYQYDNLLLYWKGHGSQSAEFCGQKLNFTESPQSILGAHCNDKAKLSTNRESASKPKAKPKPKVVTKPIVATHPSPVPTESPTPIAVDLSRSVVEVIGDNVPANGYNYYKVAVELKNADGVTVTDVVPEIKKPEPTLVSVAATSVPSATSNTAVSTTTALAVTPFTLNNNKWEATVAAQKPDTYTLALRAQDTPIKDLNLTFKGVQLPKPVIPWYVALYQAQSQPVLFLAWLAFSALYIVTLLFTLIFSLE